MSSDWRSLTLGDLARSISQYRPYLVAVAAVVLIVTVLPGDPEDDTGETLVGATPTTQAGPDAPGAGEGDQLAGATGTGGGTDTTTAATGGTASGAAGTSTGGSEQTATTGSADASGASGGTDGTAGTEGTGGEAAAGPSGTTGGAAAAGSGPDVHPRCDPDTGRMKVPMMSAAGCVPPFPPGSDNGGATYRGVTEDKIIVAIRQTEGDEAASAIVTAAGADDSDEEVKATRRAFMDMFQDRYEFYGREVEFVYFDASGEDDSAARADAVKVATEIKAFASLGGAGAYKDELVARGVMCISCTASEPIENYLATAPYVWSSLMASTQAYMHRMTYACRLWGQEAEYAGDPTLALQQRKFGIIYFETEDQSYKAGVDFAEQEFADRCGGQFTERVAYVFDTAQAQEQARTIVAKMKDSGVTSIMFAGDPIYPVFFTQEATRQNYFPEWVITGSALTDTTFFARTYDQQQWENAFGVSMLTARAPQETRPAYRVHQWYMGHPPEADDSYGVIFPGPWLLATGIHHAGPNLNPGTYQQGMFSFPLLESGITVQAQSFGQHGIWPWDDYLRYDDMTEIWWDPAATGEDEIGNQGVGMYRYVEGGKRYMVPEWPDSPPNMFDPEGTVTVYDELPEQDRPPEYECTGCPSQQQDGGGGGGE